MPQGSKKKQRKSRARKRKRAKARKRLSAETASKTEEAVAKEKKRVESPRPRAEKPSKPSVKEQQPAAVVPEIETLKARVWPVVLIITCGVLAYLSSFSAAFVFDDTRWIEANEDIRQLWPIWEHFTRGTRPLVDLSLAINYALGELDLWGYHAFNLAIHLLAALTLFGIVRRTLVSERLRQSFGRSSQLVALAVATIWVVHPLLTQSVTYIIQRAESMMGLFYLVTLYCVIRGAGSARGKWWYLAAVVACVMGMGCKPVMFTAPIVVLLYDWLFLSSSFSGLIRRRWSLYLGLAVGWLVPAMTGTFAGILSSKPTAEAAGVAFRGFGPLEYLVTQPGVILHYLKLALWPNTLCFDYCWSPAKTLPAVAFPGLVVVALVALTIWALKRKHPLGFLGVWFFVVLAPTSSIFPIKDMAVEHRMYLSLAAVVVLGVVVGKKIIAFALERMSWKAGSRKYVVGGVLLVVVSMLGYRTYVRNKDYYSKTAIWGSVVVFCPENPRGHLNLGGLLKNRGRKDEAIHHYQEAIRLSPDFSLDHYRILPVAHYNLAHLMNEKGNSEEAIKHYKEALRIDPKYTNAWDNLGVILADRGDLDGAIKHYHKALKFEPRKANTHLNLGNALKRKGEIDKAIHHYKEALQGDPGFAKAHNQIGIALRVKRDNAGAVEHFRKALQIKPDYVRAHVNLGSTLHVLGKFDEALECYNEALRLDPNFDKAHYNLGFTLMSLGRLDEAIAAFREALRIKPDFAAAQRSLNAALAKKGSTPGNLDMIPFDSEQVSSHGSEFRTKAATANEHIVTGNALRKKGEVDEAIKHYEEALRIDAGLAKAHNQLGLAYNAKRDYAKAVIHYRKAVQIDPDYMIAHVNLGSALHMLGDLDVAIESYNKALRLNPKFHKAHYNLGFAFMAQNKLDEAIAAFREALRLKPDFEIARRSLNEALAKQGKPPE